MSAAVTGGHRIVPRTVYYTATTLDGFIADPDDSLEWLLRQTEEPPDDGFFEGVGAIVMGATTYEWVLRNLDGPWPYTMPTWVMTHRSLALPEAVEGGGEPNIRFAQGSVADHYVEMCTATGDHDLWVMGGGDLAGQFADEGFLDEIITYTAPVVLGKGRPLLPRRLDLELIEVGHSAPFVIARHRVIGPLLEDG
jgi:dihydrofolate reductase